MKTLLVGLLGEHNAARLARCTMLSTLDVAAGSPGETSGRLAESTGSGGRSVSGDAEHPFRVAVPGGSKRAAVRKREAARPAAQVNVQAVAAGEKHHV